MFQLLILVGLLVTICSSTFLILWFGMELTVLFFIPFLSRISSHSTISTMWQFLMYSVTSSMVFLYSGSVISSVDLLDWAAWDSVWVHICVFMVVLFKFGFPPLHGWTLALVSGMPWFGIFILGTALKVAPVYILMNLSHSITDFGVMMPVWLIFVLWTGVSLSSLVSFSLRHIFVYSSILSSGWLILSSLSSDTLILSYFFMYTISLFNLTSLFMNWGVNIVQEISSTGMSVIEKFALVVSLMNLAGLPPSVGFVVKIAIISKLVSVSSLLISGLMVLSTLFIYNYLQIVMSFYSPNKSMSVCRFSRMSYMSVFLVTSSLIYPLAFLLV
uniref:NADH-ubiquinone oxidoreductase chain 2 n=1 Tax=Hoplopleura kitti TaxID=1511644 RepID=A0A075EC65_9NEOP|nr:NADH dehydrogenase subunit 2 [Hoplopleura kitti]